MSMISNVDGYALLNKEPNIAYVFPEKINSEIAAQFFHHERVEALMMIEKSKIKTKTFSAIANRKNQRIGALNLQEHNYTYVGLSDIDSITGDISPSSIENISGTSALFSAGDILYSKLRPYLNKVAMCPERIKMAVGSTELVVYKCKDGVNRWYIFAAVKSNIVLNQLLRITSGSTHPRVDPDFIDSAEIPFPALLIQEYIGKKIKLSEKLREESEKNRIKVNCSFEAILFGKNFHSNNEKLRMVPSNDIETDWLNSNYYRQIYKDLTEHLASYDVRIAPLSHYGKCSRKKGKPKGDIFYIEISDIDNIHGSISGGRTCSPEDTPNNAQRTVNKGDILMSTRRPDRGAVAYVDDNISNAFCSVFLAKIQTHEKLYSRFIHEYLRTNTAKLFIGQRCTVTTYPVISEDDIETIPVPVVSPELISEISEASKKASLYKKFADQLVVEAKSNVEALIEGKLDTDAILSGKLKAPTWEDIEKELEGI